MKKIAVVTTTRAEYGLLSPVLRELRKAETPEFKVDLIVSGTHLSASYGMTVNEIRSDNLRIDYTIPVSVASDTEIDISGNQADVLVKFTSHFFKEQYDAVIVLGDRYEMLAVAMAAGNTRTPVFHLCGGDTTEGAMDEWIRHSITKISYIHFVTNEESRRRVIQLGEAPERVFNYGSTSIDNILRAADMTKQEVMAELGLSAGKYALCTYHPVTMENGETDRQVSDFLSAVEDFPELQFIITKSNADQGGARINELLDIASEKIPNIHVFASLGVRRYLSLMKYAEFVLGNSSSGIIETPSFHIPTVNIGDRQRGRLQAESIINCGPGKKDIVNAINAAISERHRNICKTVKNPYGNGDAAGQIAEKVIQVIKEDKIDLKKKFFDIS